MAFEKRVQYAANISNGVRLTITSYRVYTHAWAVIRNKVILDSGFSISEKMAECAVDRRTTWHVVSALKKDREEMRASLSGEVVTAHVVLPAAKARGAYRG